MSQLSIAANPEELAKAHRSLIEQMGNKIVAAKEEAGSAKIMADQMIGAGLSAKTAKAIHKRSTDRVTYLVKCKQALEHGYVMMPDMPGEVVAVRTNRDEPTAQERTRQSAQHRVPAHKATNGLPGGMGRYVSPRQTMGSSASHEVERKRHDGTKYTETPRDHFAVALRDPDGLNTLFFKPLVIDRVTGAMSTIIFDEIVCVRPANRQRLSKDPIVLGRIVNGLRVAAFLIAWFCDPSGV